MTACSHLQDINFPRKLLLSLIRFRMSHRKRCILVIFGCQRSKFFLHHHFNDLFVQNKLYSARNRKQPDKKINMPSIQHFTFCRSIHHICMNIDRNWSDCLLTKIFLMIGRDWINGRAFKNFDPLSIYFDSGKWPRNHQH